MPTTTHPDRARIEKAIAVGHGLHTVAGLARRWGISKARADELAKRLDLPDAAVSNGTQRRVRGHAVVTRAKRRLVIDRFMTIEMAANRLVEDRTFDSWTVLAQDGGKAAPMRELNPAEKKQLGRRLYPTVVD